MATSDDLISVIIPARNAEPYIGRTLRSAQRQTHTSLEIIVVDDGSRDATASIVEAAMASDPRLSLYRSERRGASHARNLGIAKAKGDYIAPLDSDDLWARDKLARQFALLKNAPPETGVVYCWAAGIDDADNIVLPVWQASRASGDVLHAIVESGILSCGSTPLIRRRFITAVGGYDEQLHLSEDWKFYTALAGVCRFVPIAECLTGYRLRGDSASMNLDAMEQALDACTAWIRAAWPALPANVIRNREFLLATYLSFMATRAGQHRRVPGFLARALAAKPLGVFTPTFWQFPVAALAHAMGYRRFDWAFWRKPRKFVE